MIETEKEQSKYLLETAIRYAGDRLHEVIEKFARDARLDLLQILYDERMIDPAAVKQEDLRKVGYAVLPLINASKNQKAATALAVDWMSWFGRGDLLDMSRYLSYVQGMDVANALMSLGAAPNINCIKVGGKYISPIGWAADRLASNLVMVMLDKLIETQTIPMYSEQDNLFFVFARPEAGTGRNKTGDAVLRYLLNKPLTDTYRLSMGEALKKVADYNGQYSAPNSKYALTSQMLLCAMARMEDARDWMQALQRKRPDAMSIGSRIAMPGDEDIKVAALKNIVARGIDVDAIPARLEDEGLECTVLLAAVMRGNIRIVQLLLELGADLYKKTVEVGGQAIDALKLAEDLGDDGASVRGVLLARQARQKIKKVVAAGAGFPAMPQ